MERKTLTYDRFINPTLNALRALGGSATVSELIERIANDMRLTDEQLNVAHDPERGNQTEAAYRMAWARTYLKKAGLVENSQRGVWSLTAAGRDCGDVDVAALVRQVKREASGRAHVPAADARSLEEADEALSEWRPQISALLAKLPPAAFERLCQRILRECGFVEVQVKGRSGDGGIDGVGVVRLQQVLSFQVLFQCKRWKGTVSPKEIRDFRGAMVGRTDKGLFITTGSFSLEAQREAHRDGAPPIDLIDGEQLIDLMKSFRLGMKAEMVEKVVVDDVWFMNV